MHFPDPDAEEDMTLDLDTRRLLVWGIILLLAIAGLFAWASGAFAHDFWISKEERRNAAGEWCCGEGDCGEVLPGTVRVTRNGYELHGYVRLRVPNGDGSRAVRIDRVDELVPLAEAMPSPDGLYWRCHRFDEAKSRRCFFAPPPAM